MDTRQVAAEEDDTFRENTRRWYVAMELSDAALMAGLRAQAGESGDLGEAYRRWNLRRREIKDRELDQIARRHRCQTQGES